MTDLLFILHSPIATPLLFGFGLIWGSFFNVCISRIPDEQSVIFGRSHCPNCFTMLPWYLNIPVLSYVWLKGKCLYCKERISTEYPFIELFTALLFVGMFLHYGPTTKFVLYLVYLSLLLIISVIDLHLQIIPDELSLPGIVVGFFAATMIGDISWIASLLGIFLGGGSFLLIATLYEKYSGREGLGGGDVKLLAMIGAWQGYQSLLLVIVLSSFLGSIVGLLAIVVKGKNFKSAIPFGPFLAIGAIGYLFFGHEFYAFLFPGFD